MDDVKPGDFAVWIVKDGQWQFYMNYGTAEQGAKDERDYLLRAGVTARVFQKIG